MTSGLHWSIEDSIDLAFLWRPIGHYVNIRLETNGGDRTSELDSYDLTTVNLRLFCVDLALATPFRSHPFSRGRLLT
jgi:hypothetical protein